VEKKTKKKVQAHYERLYMGPDFILDFRYTQILTMTFVCFFYSGGMPFLYITTLLQLIVTYFYDKFILLKASKIPVNYDEKLESIIRPTFYIIIVLHLIVSVAMFGNHQMSSDNETISYTNIVLGNSQNKTSILFKFQLSRNLVLICLFIIIVAIFLVKGFLFDYIKKTLLYLFVKDKDLARRTRKTSGRVAPESHTHIVNHDYDLTFFQVIKSQDIATLIRLTKFTLKTTRDKALVELLKKKANLLKKEYNASKQNEDSNHVDNHVIFIGFYTYDIRLSPMYKDQFAIEEQLNHETLD